jgi:hypothetical protein
VVLLDPGGDVILRAEVRWHSETQNLAVLRLARPLDAPAVGFASHHTVQPSDAVTASLLYTDRF